MIEKRYRTKLNGQFSILWNALPLDVMENETNGNGSRDCGGIESKVSKAEVLVHARAHIQNLERTKRSLEGDRKALQDDLERLKAAWVNRGGAKSCVDWELVRRLVSKIIEGHTE
jgi:hypothetical protein